MATKLFRCPYCGRKYIEDATSLYSHMETEHTESVEEAKIPVQQIYFNYKNRYPLNKKYGKSVISQKPTKFNMVSCRYERFANEKEKEKYREYFRQNMIKVYGKDTILDEPEQQKKMLENRRISGKYKWSDDKTETTYTGSYEHKFLEFLDCEMGWENPEDIMMPAPMPFYYKDKAGKEHFHIPDVYIPSMNLIVNIKSSENKHYRERDIETEKLEDELIEKAHKFNYLKLYDNKFEDFTDALEKIRELPKDKLYNKK